MPGNLRLASEQFNRGEFFECHETLEAVWQLERGPVRDLYKGLIQVAAAFVHMTRGNSRGASRLLATALGYLEPYRADEAMGFDVDEFCRSAERLGGVLRNWAPAHDHDFDPALAPRLSWHEERVRAEAVRWRAWGFDPAGNALEEGITVVE